VKRTNPHECKHGEHKGFQWFPVPSYCTTADSDEHQVHRTSAYSKGSCFEVKQKLTLLGGLEHEFYVSIQLGISSSQLTFTPSFFRGVAQQPNRYIVDHH